VADGTQAFTLARPQFSTISGDVRVYGADWPRWQRDLYPVAYVTDAFAVARKKQHLETELRITRRCMWKALKSGERRSVETYRKAVDRYARYVRNCEVQMRLISAARLYREAA
jgi:hypothetical protein